MICVTDVLLFLVFDCVIFIFFFFKQKTAYEMRISDWSSDVCSSDLAFIDLPYAQRLEKVKRPEELAERDLLDGIWAEVNAHLGTQARSISELVEQLGIMRFGRRPLLADTFSGSGSIPFEAARIGCDVIASDLNPKIGRASCRERVCQYV